MKIIDGKGRGFEAGVDPHHHLMVTSQGWTAFEHACVLGDVYVLSSGLVNMTGTGETAMIYMSNIDPIISWKVDHFTISMGPLSGAVTGSPLLSIGYGQMTGTLVSSGTIGIPANLNQNNKSTPNGVFRVSSGSGMTLGVVAAPYLNPYRLLPANALYELSAGTVLGPGAVLGLSITPPSGTVGLQAIIVAHFFLVDAGEFE